MRNFSHICPDVNWKEALRDSKKKAAKDPRGSAGLQMMCPFPGCETIDPLLLFKHPKTGHECYLCNYHWRMAQVEAREMQWRHQTLTTFLARTALETGGTLKFASLGPAPTVHKFKNFKL
jgi:hypothetical protein